MTPSRSELKLVVHTATDVRYRVTSRLSHLPSVPEFRQDSWQRISPLLRHLLTCHRVSGGRGGQTRIKPGFTMPDSLLPNPSRLHYVLEIFLFGILTLFYLAVLSLREKNRDWRCLRKKVPRIFWLQTQEVKRDLWKCYDEEADRLYPSPSTITCRRMKCARHGDERKR